jgi:hypothetical protein
MSSLVVTMVYVMVFLSGEGLSGEQIKNDASRDYDLVNRHWLRVRSAHKGSHTTKRLTLKIGTIRPRHLLGYLCRNRATGLPQILRPPLRNQNPRA